MSAFSTALARKGQAQAFINRHRKLLLIGALALFAIGCFVSVRDLALNWHELDADYLALLALILAPLGIAYGALNMVVMARGANIRIGFVDALRIASLSQFAELLPLPGGALVRGGAMIQRGARALDATTLVIVNAVLWIACAACAAAFSFGLATMAGAGFGITGALGVGFCMAWLGSRAGWKVAIATLATRLAGLVLSGARVGCAFFVIGTAVTIGDVYPFVFATILGSASSISPGGLGISETTAAAVATLSTIAPSAAFLAVGIDRVVGLIAGGVATLLFHSIKAENQAASA